RPRLRRLHGLRGPASCARDAALLVDRRRPAIGHDRGRRERPRQQAQDGGRGRGQGSEATGAGTTADPGPGRREGPPGHLMPLFSRSDGTLIKTESAVRQIMPYLMRGRNEAVVYHETRYDLTRTLPWLAAQNAALPGDSNKKI